MNCLVEENEKLIKELNETKMKFNEITERFENGYENIIREIKNSSKNIVTNIDNSIDNSVDNSDNSDNRRYEEHNHICNIF